MRVVGRNKYCFFGRGVDSQGQLVATLVSSCHCWEMDAYLSSSNVGGGRDTLGRRRLNNLEQSDSAICISLGFFSKYGPKTKGERDLYPSCLFSDSQVT